MYDSVPHTRPIVVTGNPGDVEMRPGAAPPMIQQRQSQYEGPTTIMTKLSDEATEMGLGMMTFMAHLHPRTHPESSSSRSPDDDPPTLSPEIERFLKDLDLGT
jgi:hypothetical protein